MKENMTNPREEIIMNRYMQEQTWPEYFDDSALAIEVGGEKLIKRYGKYNPGICFLLSDKNISTGWNNYDTNFLNIDFDASSVKYMPGDFWTSKKGTSCFRPGENGKHLLVESNWGGCFQSSRGEEYDEVKKLSLYSRRASSNGGGVGTNYYIFKRDFRKELSLDDI